MESTGLTFGEREDWPRGMRDPCPRIAALRASMPTTRRARYRKMLEMPLDAAHRQVITRMLAEEERLLQKLGKSTP